jgi:hypothetical protein
MIRSCDSPTRCRHIATALVTALCLVIVLGSASATGQAAPSLAEIGAMQTHLDQHGFDGFREAVAANGWQAPLIPSQWYVENRATTDGVPKFHAARHLGLTIVRKADDWAPLMLVEEGSALMDKVVRLVDVAEWIGSAYGYGNLLASYRACGAAITGLAQFVADLNHRLPEIKQQLARCNTPISTGSGRGKVLNFEIADDVFPTSSGTTIEALSDFWGLRMGRIHYHDANPEEREGQRDLFNLVLSMLATAGINADEPDPYADFFTRRERCDAVPDTTETCWSVTFHEMVARGTPSNNNRLKNLDRLILFRETVGHFPTEPRMKGSRYGDRNRAFDEAWDPIATSDTVNLGGGAENTLRSIEESRFVDADTHQLRLMEQRSSWTQTAAALTETPEPPQTPSPVETPGP